MARNPPLAAAESADLLRLSAQFTWCCDRDLRVERVEPLDGADSTGDMIRLRGRRLDKVAVAALYPAERRFLADRLAQRSDFVDTTLTLATEDHRTVHLCLSAMSIKDGDGRFLGYRGIGRAGSERPYDAFQRQELVSLLHRAETARDREAALRRESEALLGSLQALHQPLPLAEKCRLILQKFETILEYEAAIVFRRGVHGALSSVATTLVGETALSWPDQRIVAAALAGQPSLHEDLATELDASSLPPPLRRLGRAALFAPLTIGRETAVLVALHSRPGTFTDAHLAALRRLGLVTEQALAAEDSKITIANASKLATLGEMLAAIVHEVNQPLSVISMSAQNAQLLVESGDPDGQLLAKLARIEEQARRASEIVSAIRSLAHPGRAGPTITTAPLADVFHSLDVLCTGSMRAKGIALTLAAPAHDLAVTANLSGLEQVLLNLIVNARDAVAHRMQADGVQSGGRIAVTAEPLADGSHVRIRVADNGGGIPEDVIERIFDPFFTLKAAGAGTGLGLSICQSLVAEMGATMRVRNGDEGAIFEIDLAAAETEAA